MDQTDNSVGGYRPYSIRPAGWCKLVASRIHVLFMRTTPASKLIGALVCVTVLLASLALGITRVRSFFGRRAPIMTAAHSNDLPRLILWAWERPTDLTFINRRTTGVAFLARTIHLRADEVITRPRLQPLSLPEAATVIAVARVESDPEKKPELSDEQRDKLVSAIVELASLPNISAVQIDFDASRSERAFYHELIVDVRQRLPVQV